MGYQEGVSGRLIFAVIAGAFGSAFQHGYNTGVLNNPQQLIESWASDVVQNRTGKPPTEGAITIIWSIAVAVFCVGGMIGGLLTGVVANKFGRKGGLLINNILVFVGAALEGFAKHGRSYEMIIAGRLFIGINSGLNAGLAPLYLNEISPVNLRGAIGSVYQLIITISIMFAQAMGLKQVLGTENSWPLLLAMTIIPAIFQLFTLPFCPESPKFLLAEKGKEEEAENALTWLRGKGGSVQEELDVIRAEYEAGKLLPKVTMRDLMVRRELRIPMIISIVVMLSQQFSGINAVIFYSTKIFTTAELSEDNATYATLGMGTINVLMTIVSLILVEKAGRKTLLLIGFAGMTVDTILLTVVLVLVQSYNQVSYLCIALIFIFIILFATGPGSIPWFLVTELFNQSARPVATSVAVAINWLANFIVGLSFLPLQAVMGPYVFLIFSAILAFVVFFVYKKVPETKNKTEEEIAVMFRQQSYQ